MPVKANLDAFRRRIPELASECRNKYSHISDAHHPRLRFIEYDVLSLHQLDYLLPDVGLEDTDANTSNEETLEEILPMIGAFWGETLRRQVRGKWEILREDSHLPICGLGISFSLGPTTYCVYPYANAARRILLGPEHSLGAAAEKVLHDVRRNTIGHPSGDPDSDGEEADKSSDFLFVAGAASPVTDREPDAVHRKSSIVCDEVGEESSGPVASTQRERSRKDIVKERLADEERPIENFHRFIDRSYTISWVEDEVKKCAQVIWNRIRRKHGHPPPGGRVR